MRTLLLTLMICVFVLPAQAKYSGGTGEPNDPYQIATAADLIALGETPEDYDKHFILTADIDLDPNLPGRKVFDRAVIAPDTNGATEWFEGIAFTGVFDGAGHTIQHLTITGGSCLGLFGQVGFWNARNCEVKNLGFVDVNVIGSGKYIGSLAGLNSDYGAVRSCHATGTVNGGMCVGGLIGFNGGGPVMQSWSDGAVVGNDMVGGLVGQNGFWTCILGDEPLPQHEVTNCYSTAAVNGNEVVGGLVGLNEVGAVKQSYSTGTVCGSSSVGGLVGSNNEASVSNCHGSGSVSGTDYVGGLVGRNRDSSIVMSYSRGSVTGTDHVGGLVGYEDFAWHESIGSSFWDTQTSGQATSAGGTGKTTTEMQTASTFLDAGWDFVGETANGTEDIWKIVEGVGYPRLSWEKYSGGTGEPNDPYQIATAADLIALGETPEDYGKHFILTADIDLDPNLPGRKVFDRAVIAPDTELNDQYSEFQGTRFTGVFDGNGHTISHLTIAGKDYVGLFGQLGFEARVSDLGLEAVDVNGTGGYVGALVGFSSGSITTSYSTGSVNGFIKVGGLVGYSTSYNGTVTQCYSAGTVSGGGTLGGLVGHNEGRVSQCYSTGTVSGGGDLGGLAGYNLGRVTQCYSTGTVTHRYITGTFISEEAAVGGLVGNNVYLHWDVGGDVAGVVSHCYSTGRVNGSGKNIGGLVGLNGEGVVSYYSFWDIETSGQATSAGGTGKTTAEMQTPRTFRVWGTCGNEGVWTIDEGKDYPRLWWEDQSGEAISSLSLTHFLMGTGEESDPFLIYTAEELNMVGLFPCEFDKHFKLMADIDLSAFDGLDGRPEFNIIGCCSLQTTGLARRRFWLQGYPFAGVFDGNGHIISSLTAMGNNYMGLFSGLENQAEVKNLGVVDANITGSYGYVGVLAGCNCGTVSHCYSTGTVYGGSVLGVLAGFNFGTVTQCYSTGAIYGGFETGGLVGSNWGTVAQCYSSSTVSGGSYVGGLVGYTAGGGIMQCYSMGEVSGEGHVGGLVGHKNGIVMQCYSTGAVSGSSEVGGLVGHDESTHWGLGDSSSSFWDKQTSGQTGSDGETGKTTAEMQTAKTFLDTGWDFVGETDNGTEDIWWINEGKDYPRLWWEAPAIDDR